MELYQRCLQIQCTPYCVRQLYCRLLKECEREGRLYPSTKVPLRPERFWPCGKNEEKLQRLSRTFFINESKENDISIILSGLVAIDGEIKNSFKL